MSPILSSFSAEDVVAAIPDPLIVIDSDGIVSFANKAYEEMLGYSRKRAHNKHFMNLEVFQRSSANQTKIMKEHFDLLLRGKQIDTIEVTLVTKTSTKVVGEIRLFALEDSLTKVKWIIASFKDLTEIKEAHEEIRKSEERYRRLFDNAKVGMFHTDMTDGRVIRCNEIGARLLGFEDPQQAMNEFVISEHYVDSGARQQLLDGLMETGDVTNFQAEITQHDGTPIWIEVSGVLYPEEGILESVIVDITERKRAEDALSESEERFRTFVESSENGFLVLQGTPPRVIYANSALSQIIGFSQEEVMSMSAQDILSRISETHRDGVSDNLFGALQEGKAPPTFNELQFRRKDNTLIWVRTDPSLITLNNEPAYQALVIDVTDQRELTDALRESEKKFLLFADYFPGLIFMKDSDSRFIFVNSFVKTIFGATEFIDKTPYEVYLDQEVAQRHMLEDQRILQGEVIEQVEILPDIYGNEYVYRTTLFPINREDGSVLIGGLSVDITTLTEIEQALQLTQFSIDNAADPIFWTDDKARIVYANIAMSEKLGIPRDDLVGMSVSEIDLETTDEGWPQFIENIKKIKFASFESRLKTWEGEDFPVEISVNYLEFEHNAYLFAVVKDITERNTVRSELESALDNAEFFVDIMGHDLSNINQAIFGLIEVVLFDETLSEHVKELLEDSVSQISRATGLITSVQKFRRIERTPPELTSQDPAVALSIVTKIVDESFPEKKLEIQTSLKPGMFSILADEFLQDIFFNLIQNSIQHDSREAVIVDILAKLDDSGDFLEVTVNDRGSGIPDKLKVLVLDRISKKKEGYWGTGIGLTLTKRIMEHYGGKIRVEDRVDGDSSQGTSIILLFPVSE